MLRACVVLTTIFDPIVLESYYKNFEKFGRLEQIEIVVIPDRKSPASTWTRCQDLSRRGLRVTCPTLEEQESYLARLGMPSDFIPYDSDNRRNIGFLMALESGADFTISLDDDNYARDDVDAFAEHAVVCAEASVHSVVDSSTGLFNICDLLVLEGASQTIYARGYPFYGRHKKVDIAASTLCAEIHVNAGLWLIDPDVEAISWLVAAPQVVGFRDSKTLGKRTWSPINTQNTAVRSVALPAYYYVRMGYPVAGHPIDRYGDIFSGYFLQACAKQLDGLIRVGTPVAEHRRNAHNFLRDAMSEWGGIIVLEELLPWICEVKLSGNSYLETYRCLSAELTEAAERIKAPGWNDSIRGFLHRTAYHMRLWAVLCETITS